MLCCSRNVLKCVWETLVTERSHSRAHTKSVRTRCDTAAAVLSRGGRAWAFGALHGRGGGAASEVPGPEGALPASSEEPAALADGGGVDVVAPSPRAALRGEGPVIQDGRGGEAL